MQDNYIAVHFQRSFHDMGGDCKSAVELFLSILFLSMKPNLYGIVTNWSQYYENEHLIRIYDIYSFSKSSIYIQA